MCETCRRHHPELYTDKPAAKPEKKGKHLRSSDSTDYFGKIRKPSASIHE